MKLMGDGKVYTDFIIYHAEDYVKYIKEQEAFVCEYSQAYISPAQKAIQTLKNTEFYSQRLERYMLINIAEIGLWRSLKNHRKPQVFPNRPNGGKWIAFGDIYPKEYIIPEEKRGRAEYELAGQRCTRIDDFLEAKNLKLYNYETSLYPYPKHSGYEFNSFQEVELNMLKLFYLINKNILPETVAIDTKIIKAIPILEERGFITTTDGKPRLLIPCLSHAQEKVFWNICKEASDAVAKQLEEPMADYIKSHKKEIPPHLKSVPDQKLTMPYEPNTMMFVFEAINQGLHPRDLGYPCPETFVVFD